MYTPHAHGARQAEDRGPRLAPCHVLGFERLLLSRAVLPLTDETLLVGVYVVI